MVGNYRIIAEIGGGAMGVVYRAFDVDLEMERAIKILRPGKPEQLRRKFEAEGKITARLDHPNIVRVYGGGVFQNLPFIQMELVNGKSLRLLLDALTRVHPIIALSIVSVIADALDYASTKSFSIWGSSSETLVHRDLKPENILFSRTGGLKVADFGLAKTGDEKDFTGWGTVEYMSPEQHDNKTVDCRSDIFSLGIILYEMLCGARPFPGNPDDASSAKHEGKYDSVLESNPSAPEMAVALVRECLEPKIENRIQTYKEVKEFANNVLKTLTDQSAAEIVNQFSADPVKYRPNIDVDKFRIKKKFPVKLIAIIFPLLVLLLTGSWFLTKNKLEKHEAIALKDTIAVVNSPVLRTDSLPAITDIKPPRTETTASLSVVQQPKLKPAKPFQIIPEKVQHIAESSILFKAITAHENGKYSDVINLIQESGFKNLPSATRDSAVILLTDSYYMTHSIKDVIGISKHYDVNDARYYWVIARAFKVMQNNQKAMLYIDKAAVAPTRIGEVSREDILYERADIYLNNFNTLQDSASKKDMLDAYNQFIKESCGRNETEKCLKAKQLLKKYE